MTATPPPSFPPPPPAGGPPPPPPGGGTPYGGAPYGGPPAGATPVSGRNRTAAIIALIATAVIVLGTFLPIVTFEFGEFSESANGWSSDINDGPIHVFFALLPLAAGVAVLKQGGRTWAKVLLIVGAVIGWFWAAIRFADISGSLEEEEGLGTLVADIADPGVGLWLITLGWTAVFVAGLMTKEDKGAAAPPTTF